MGDWVTFAAIHLAVGLNVILFGIQSYTGGSFMQEEGLLATGLLFYIVAAVMLIIVKVGDVELTFVIKIVIIIVTLLAAILPFVAIVQRSGFANHYAETIIVSSSLLGFIGFIFVLLTLLPAGSMGKIGSPFASSPKSDAPPPTQKSEPAPEPAPAPDPEPAHQSEPPPPAESETHPNP